MVGRLVFKHPLQNVGSLEWPHRCVGLDSSSCPFLLFPITCQPFGKHTGCLFGWLFSCRKMCCEERNRRQRARDMGTCLFAANWIVPQGGRTHSPFVHLAPAWGTSWSPIWAGNLACAGSVGCRGVPGLSLCITTAPGSFAWGDSAGLCPLKDN